MPKEMIHERDFAREVHKVDSTGPNDTVVINTNAVKIGWSKEAEHVELAVVQMVDGAFIEHGFETEIGRDMPVEDQVRLAGLTPQYIQLDRYGINRMIHTLRQARDDAFGKDA